MTERLWFVLPECVMLLGVVICAINGVSRSAAVRQGLPGIAIATLVGAWIASMLVYGAEGAVSADGPWSPPLPWLGAMVLPMACAVGIVLVFVQGGAIDRRYEARVASGQTSFDPLRSSRGEYWVFFLLSIMGLMLTCGAPDLIWLFLGLELTSLPTYVMVAVGRYERRSQEAAMKYFFLGALSAAMFLFGFALLYGATGTLSLTEMASVLAERHEATGSVGSLAIIGLLLSFFGISFKLAAAPLHLYAADVYEGAAAHVTAFLGFVPKAAGAVAAMLLLTILGDGPLPDAVLVTLWIMAVLTMTLGNIGALLQQRTKRMLAYSSIAHSGYLFIGLIAGPGAGYAAVLVYLVAYGFGNTATFAVLASLKRDGEEVETLEELAGLRERHPRLAWALAISAGSLLGFPPLLGFWGKLLLFIAGVASGHVVLVIIAGVNSAISAWYYLRLVALPLTSDATGRSRGVECASESGPKIAALLGCLAVVVLPLGFAGLTDMADEAVGTVKNSSTEVAAASLPE